MIISVLRRRPAHDKQSHTPEVFCTATNKSKSKGSGSTLTLKTFLNIRKNSVSIKLSFQMGFPQLISVLIPKYLSQSLFNKVPLEPEVTRQHCIQQKLLHNCIHGLHPLSRGEIHAWPETTLWEQLVKRIHGNRHAKPHTRRRRKHAATGKE